MSMSLIACLSIYQGHNDELFSDYSQGRQEILMSLAAHSQYFSPVDSQYSLPVEFTR